MASYDGYSRSNNALQAENEGMLPLSRAAKAAGVSVKLIRQHVEPCEWHHASCKYNRTDYYDVEQIRATFGLAESENFEARPEAVEAIGMEPTFAIWRRIRRHLEPGVLAQFDRILPPSAGVVRVAMLKL